MRSSAISLVAGCRGLRNVGRSAGMTLTKTLVVLCAAAALLPASAAAAPPTVVREDIDETFVDEFLSEDCGVEATVHLTGHQIARTREGGGVRDVFTVNLTGIITSEFG